MMNFNNMMDLDGRVVREINQRGAFADPFGKNEHHRAIWDPPILNPSTSRRTSLPDFRLDLNEPRARPAETPCGTGRAHGSTQSSPPTPMRHMTNRGYYIEFLINKCCLSDLDANSGDLMKLMETKSISFTYNSGALSGKIQDRWAAMSAKSLETLLIGLMLVAYVCRRQFAGRRADVEKEGGTSARERNQSNFTRTTFKILIDENISASNEVTQIPALVERVSKVNRYDGRHEKLIPDDVKSFVEMFDALERKMELIYGDKALPIDKALLKKGEASVHDGKLRCFIGHENGGGIEELTGRRICGIISDVKADPIISFRILLRCAKAVIQSNRENPSGHQIGDDITMTRAVPL